MSAEDQTLIGDTTWILALVGIEGLPKRDQIAMTSLFETAVALHGKAGRDMNKNRLNAARTHKGLSTTNRQQLQLAMLREFNDSRLRPRPRDRHGGESK